MGFWTETLSRISAESPTYFKKVGRMGVGFTAAGMSMLATGMLPESVHVPPILNTAGGYLLVAGIVAKSVASLACANPEDIKK